MKEIKKIVEEAIKKIAEEFKENKALYLSESDMKCRLFKLIDLDKKYNTKEGVETYYIHTETRFGLKNEKKNFIDIYIGKFEKIDLKKNDWTFSREGEDIGIELKYNYGKNISKLKKQLKKDKRDLNKAEIDYKFMVCFDHNGLLSNEDFNKLIEKKEFKWIKVIYVDGKNQKIHQNAI